MEAPSVQYVHTSDGYSIAYAVRGQGRPLVWMPHLYSHIEIYWKQPTFIRAWLETLAGRFQLIQYDGRGQGMSSRGLTKEHTLTDRVLDLEAVIERLQLRSFTLMAVGSSGHVALHYAAANPQRVDALILEACPVQGWTYSMSLNDQLASQDWDGFIRLIAAQGQPADVPGSVARLKQTVTQEDHLALMRAYAASDVSGLLPSVNVPTLVIHPRDYFSLAPEEAMKLASGLPNARMAMTDGVTAPGDPAQGIAAIEEFLASLGPEPDARGADEARGSLSSREVEVLRLVATGKSNQQIADELVISLNTVRRHVSNVFDKTGVANRAQAALYARDHGLI
ncbi:MAG TPA: alpha/beta fold hydrolase [Dehalococcoidia bacterium]|nr:alpha/beta fold hydrolase [Dehalococcoidia bacterium]